MEVERPLGVSDCSEVAGQAGVSAVRLDEGQKEKAGHHLSVESGRQFRVNGYRQDA